MTTAASPLLHWSSRPDLRVSPPARLSVAQESDDDRCTLVRGDNLLGLSALGAEYEGQATLIYMDPPYMTGREHHRVQRVRDEGGAISRSSNVAFDDRWSDLGDYLGALGQRVAAARRLLAPHGSFVLHVDPKTSHYARVLCDEIFGFDCFASEIVWRYRRWPSKTRNFQRVHDVLLRYVKDPRAEVRFNQLYEPLAPSTQATWGDRKQRAVTDASGRRTRSSTTDEASRGTPMGDVWDISIVAPVARERTGYPTQKPEALLGRLIEACTDPGDLVIDPYMGSGTTLAAAVRRGRRAVGLDVGEDAFQITQARLAALDVRCGVHHVEPALAASKRRAAPVAEVTPPSGPRVRSRRAASTAGAARVA